MASAWITPLSWSVQVIFTCTFLVTNKKRVKQLKGYYKAEELNVSLNTYLLSCILSRPKNKKGLEIMIIKYPDIFFSAYFLKDSKNILPFQYPFEMSHLSLIFPILSTLYDIFPLPEKKFFTFITLTT